MSELAAGVLFGGAALYAINKMANTSMVPSYEKLCFLLSSQNQFGLEHARILNQLAAACSDDVNKMMSVIELPALAVASQELSSQFPPASLPINTNYSIKIEYRDPRGKLINSELSLYNETGAQVYTNARAATIKDYCTKNIFPLLKRMFADCVQFRRYGYSELEIFNKMSAPDYGKSGTVDIVVPNKVAFSR